nr:hypothetical protein Iba_chr05aCG0350 [Ipomoea batatas]
MAAGIYTDDDDNKKPKCNGKVLEFIIERKVAEVFIIVNHNKKQQQREIKLQIRNKQKISASNSDFSGRIPKSCSLCKGKPGKDECRSKKPVVQSPQDKTFQHLAETFSFFAPMINQSNITTCLQIELKLHARHILQNFGF